MNPDACKTQRDIDRDDAAYRREIDEYLAEQGAEVRPIPTGSSQYVLMKPGDLWVGHGDVFIRIDGDNQTDAAYELGPVARSVLIARLQAEAIGLDRAAPVSAATNGVAF